MQRNKPIGPNLRRLIAIVAAKVGSDTYGSSLAGMIESVKNMQQISEVAYNEVEKMLFALKSASDNPHGDDEEALAGMILEALKEK